MQQNLTVFLSNTTQQKIDFFISILFFSDSGVQEYREEGSQAGGESAKRNPIFQLQVAVRQVQVLAQRETERSALNQKHQRKQVCNI